MNRTIITDRPTSRTARVVPVRSRRDEQVGEIARLIYATAFEGYYNKPYDQLNNAQKFRFTRTAIRVLDRMEDWE